MVLKVGQVKDRENANAELGVVGKTGGVEPRRGKEETGSTRVVKAALGRGGWVGALSLTER